MRCNYDRNRAKSRHNSIREPPDWISHGVPLYPGIRGKGCRVGKDSRSTSHSWKWEPTERCGAVRCRAPAQRLSSCERALLAFMIDGKLISQLGSIYLYLWLGTE